MFFLLTKEIIEEKTYSYIRTVKQWTKRGEGGGTQIIKEKESKRERERSRKV